jgi:hypothetical protein
MRVISTMRSLAIAAVKRLRVADEHICSMLISTSVLHANYELLGRQKSSDIPIHLSTQLSIEYTCELSRLSGLIDSGASSIWPCRPVSETAHMTREFSCRGPVSPVWNRRPS